jgi:asparagine synthase (glutamine-hydrolysing)
MCGIAAAIGHVDPIVAAAVRRASECQRARGPDAAGEWSGGPGGDPSAGGAVLAFRRLKIIDLSDSANQPMVDPDTGHVVVFNGEIYNFRVLREELGRAGHRFRTGSDTEVILRAYAQWGEACVERLRGMFAFILWDVGARRALVARDRLGIKPLYYATVRRPGGGAVLLASQLRAILATGLVEPRLDPGGLSTFLWNGFVVGPGTIVAGIREVPAASVGVVEADGTLRPFRRYWSIPAPADRGGDVPNLRRRLEEAVDQHMISDVPLGVFLSGGIDSTAVAALASRVSSRRVRTFTICFEEAEYDESVHARRVAQHLGSDHHEVLLGESSFRDRLDDALASIDQPTFDAINSYMVSRAVKEAGLTVAMAGTGGDELFGGYRSFRDLPRAQRWSRRLDAVPSAILAPAAGAFSRVKAWNFGPVPPQTRWGRLADALGTGGRLVELYQVAYSLFTRDFAARLSGNGTVRACGYGLPGERLEELGRLAAGRPILSAISALELSLFLGERLLRDTDASSMEVSLEVRVPLLDHEVVEAAFALPDDRRFQPVRSKSLLREIALEGLPADLFDRPKRGFELPLEHWCRRGLRDQVAATLLDRARCEAAGLNPDTVAALWRAYDAGAPGLYWSRVWALFVLLWWCRRHGVSM